MAGWTCILMFSLSTHLTLQIEESFCTKESFMTEHEKLTLISLTIHHPLIHQNALNIFAYKTSCLECKCTTNFKNML
jgi:hypothetical protein